MCVRLRCLFFSGFLAAVCGPAIGSGSVTVDEPTHALVDSVQMPAWFERQGVRQPLTPGRKLHNRDRVLTGPGGRVVLAFAEGSVLRLGADGQLSLNALGRREGGVFTAAVDVAQGAFRFTSGVFPTAQEGHAPRRAVNLRVASITAGSRGADLWGRADDERDLVCLLEGQATVTHAQDEQGFRALDAPMSVYFARRGEPPDGVAPAGAAQIRLWTQQTGIAPGEGGFAQRRGRWSIELAVLDNEMEALKLHDRLGAAGYATRIHPQPRPAGGFLYGLRLTQVPTREGAEALALHLAERFELPAVRVTR